jgi:hypothetical protein
LRFIPNVLIGMILNLSTGLLVHRIRADYLILFTSFLCAGSPLLMAIIHPDWSWWYCAFWAVLLGPLSADGASPSLPPTGIPNLADFLSNLHGGKSNNHRCLQPDNTSSRRRCLQHRGSIRKFSWHHDHGHHLFYRNRALWVCG